MKASAPPVRPAEKLRRMGGWIGGSIGQAEALAGINVQSHQERAALWGQFRHLFLGKTQTLLDAVADHCAQITLARLDHGELCLLKTGQFRRHGPVQSQNGLAVAMKSVSNADQLRPEAS